MANFTHFHKDAFTETREDSEMIHKAYFISLMVLIPTTLVGNVLVTAVITTIPKLRKEPMYIFLTSLAVADMLVGALSMPIKAKVEWDNGKFNLPWPMCWVFNLGEIIFAIAAILHLCVISADRYFALKYTYEYRILMCKKIHLSVLLFVWTFSVVWSILGIFQWDTHHDFSIRREDGRCSIINRNYFTTTYVICFIAPICLITFIYLFIYKSEKRRVTVVSMYDYVDSALKNKNDSNQHLRRLHSIIVVFVAHVICWMPCVILSLLIFFDESIQEISEEDWFFTLRYLFISFLPRLNSSLNPLLYVIFNKELRCSCRKFFFKMIGNKLMGNSYGRNNRFSMPADLRGILYSDDEDDGMELDILTPSQHSPPRRRYTF